MTYKARRAVINKRRIFARHKDSAHPRCKEANRNAAKEVRSAKFNYEKKLADNVKLDAKSFYAYVRSRGNSRTGVGALLSRDDGERVESPEELAEEFILHLSYILIFLSQNGARHVTRPLIEQSEPSEFDPVPTRGTMKNVEKRRKQREHLNGDINNMDQILLEQHGYNPSETLTNSSNKSTVISGKQKLKSRQILVEFGPPSTRSY